MTVAGFIFLITGFLMETLWLFKTSGNPKRPGWMRYFLYIEGGILALGLLSAGLALLMGKAETMVSDNVRFFDIPGLLLLAVLFKFVYNFDDFIYAFMPRVTEQSILVVQFIALVLFIQSKPDLPQPIFLSCTGLPLIMMICLVASKKNIPSVMKILLYFCYLLILVVQSVLSWFSLAYMETGLSLSDCFFLGVYYCFYVAHLSFLTWMIEIIKKLWPHFDVEFATRTIKPFFFDDQISILPFLFFISSTSGIVYLLYYYEVPQANLWANLMIILIIQVLFNPQIRYWFKHKLYLVD